MPNWVRNEIEFTGSKTELEQLVATVTGGDRAFDFEKIIPMPETLRIISGSGEETAMIAYGLLMNDQDVLATICQHIASQLFYSKERLDRDWSKAEELRDKWLKDHNSESLDHTQIDLSTDGVDLLEFPEQTFEAYARHGKVYYENVKLYGTPDWYEWCCENWGTKWNANEVNVGDIAASPEGCGILQIEFDTAWSMPEPIFVKLSEMFPTIRMNGRWADEDMGSNCGMWTAYEGIMAITNADMLSDPLKLACSVWGYDYDEYVAEMKADQDVEDNSAEGQ